MPTPRMHVVHSSNTERLLEYMKDLQARIKVERARDNAVAELRGFLERRPLLGRKDVIAVANQMKPQRGNKPVKTLKNNPRATSKAVGKVGKAIRAGRMAAKLTVNELATKVGCSGGLISLWELGKGKPKGEKLAALSKALGRPENAFTNGHAPS